MTILKALILTGVLALALPAGSLAQESVPQDNAGGGQYIPSVPQADGNKPEVDVKNDARPSDEKLPEPVVSELESQGSDGAAAAATAAATAPQSDALEAVKRRQARRVAARRAERRKARRAAARRAERRAESRARDQLDAANASAGLPGSSDERLGIALPILLGSSLLVTLLVAWRRRRATGASPPA